MLLRSSQPELRVRLSPALLLPVLCGVSLAGCAGGTRMSPGEPTAPPPPATEPAWRPAEAMAYLLSPPAEGAFPIDDDYLERTKPYRVRIAEARALRDELRRIERKDPGGRRVWYFDGSTPIFVEIDAGDDGTLDQAQYFGPEGLFAVVHRFANGRRTQRVYWPPGRPKYVEIRDNLPPYPGSGGARTRTPSRSAPTSTPRMRPPGSLNRVPRAAVL